MQRVWSVGELGECWSLLPEDLALLTGRVDAGKLGFAVQLAFWRQHGRFPDDEADIAPAVIAHLAGQIGIGVDALDGYAWAGRSGRRHRVASLDHRGVGAVAEAAQELGGALDVRKQERNGAGRHRLCFHAAHLTRVRRVVRAAPRRLRVV